MIAESIPVFNDILGLAVSGAPALWSGEEDANEL